jgi:predicted ABC-type ATPase
MREDNQPLLIVIAGPNGSGKSTIIERLKKRPEFPERYINADDIKMNEGLTDFEAWKKAEQQRADALNNRESFSFETVLSHPSKIDLMEEAKKAGYWIQLYFICLQDVEINVQRVQKRHQCGGHNVPEDKIRSRYLRSIQILSQALPIANEAAIYNNSLENPSLIARKTQDGEIHIYPMKEKDSRSKWSKIEIEKLLQINKK